MYTLYLFLVQKLQQVLCDYFKDNGVVYFSQDLQNL